MPPPRATPAEPEQSAAQIAATLEAFLAEQPNSILLEDGKVLFDMRSAKYSLATEHNRCTLHRGRRYDLSERRELRRSTTIEAEAPRERVA